MSIAEGQVFAGYRILRLLGTGGMGEVYLVQHPRLPRQEALKILPSAVSADPQFRARFAREADIAATLWHPHIVAVHDRGEDDGQLWITMDYVEGKDAAELLRNRYPHGMPPAEAFEIVSAIAEALDYAHERYLLHRDVKPANILLTDKRQEDRRILLADFGIARDTFDSGGLTATNVTVGSVAYAAPEQLTGQPLDGHADQYALAATAFHLLTGTVPFSNTNPAVVIGNHLSSPPPRIASIRPDLGDIDDVLGKAMAKEPRQRFATCRAFATALTQRGARVAGSGDATQLGVPASAAPTMYAFPASVPEPVERQERSSWRWPLIAAAVAAGLLAVGLVAFLGARLGQPSPPGAQPQPTASPWPETIGEPDPRRNTTSTAPRDPPTQPNAAPTPPTVPPRPPVPPTGDLGLRQPMSRPVCNGQYIVILGSVTTPGLYEAGVQRLLDAHPGAFYLRADQTCPSLRAATEDGNPIYAVFRPGGTTQAQMCAAVRAAGGDAYGKVLDYITDPGVPFRC
ncbi:MULTISPECIES: serine/threonine-protein kinase [Mycolicibacterium]|uniref:non-specific serine/threonine protein kinase n=1 Tax=Mycolicibacterium senegalense TaxID=1796 RepID=A0A378W8N6_9MYCO|nr:MULTISPECIES: serine/threonine-protein kinase [Mycolicibacterium]MCV7338175.1 serine/threonine protein kinase [Mycolicibacterium senegalense]MDR7287458.1 serine/threonine-protein kinase [Mycolicibacterium senegalense]QZA24512.1 serine/threonine protein kinase [Mycolicibacterium senegalense]CDP87375.1 serine/threonine protein kinase [Mycolicibacterium farcinogenes]SUA28964.1 anchored-membrane serine/threonine-protein kinase PknF [Mycolicibacterium senegalense]